MAWSPYCCVSNAADAFHLLRAGLAGDPDKGVPDRPLLFVTLTASSPATMTQRRFRA
jgi:hypothetical protein